MGHRFTAAVAAAVLAAAGAAQEAVPDEKAEFAELLDDARSYAIRPAGSAAALKLHEPPVLNFTNPERNQERGSVFVWLDDGRPAAVGQFFRFDMRGRRLKKHALHSLAAGPLDATFRDKPAWAPDRAGVAWKPFPDAPAPAASRAGRLLQMRQLARPFRVELSDPKGEKTELRLAPRPLFEYAAPRAGVTDGVIFSYLVATDPEAVLLVEAFAEGGKTGFRYAFARFHFWRLTATLGDTAVWEAEHDPAQLRNTLGQSDTMAKVYNSFHVAARR